MYEWIDTQLLGSGFPASFHLLLDHPQAVQQLPIIFALSDCETDYALVIG
jgi:hypothetical protein